MLSQMHIWFAYTLDINNNVFAFVIFLMMLVVPPLTHRSLYRKIDYRIAIIGCLLSINFYIVDTLQASLASICLAWLGISIFQLKDGYKKKLIEDFTKWFAVLNGISLICFLCSSVIPFPLWNYLSETGYRWGFWNYGLFVKPELTDLFLRFQGPFMEPGHLGIACVFLMYANHLNFKRNYYMWTLLVVCIFTFSLATYVLLAIAFILNMRIKVSYITVASLALLIPYIYITQIWDNGKNPVNLLIFSRLEYDSDKGISGNNRFTVDTDARFEEWIKSGNLIIGKGVVFYSNEKADNKLGGAGYKIYMIQFGIIGTVLIFWLYWAMALYNENRRYAVIFFVIFALCFLQRTYPFWMSWFIPYSCSMTRSALSAKDNRFRKKVRAGFVKI